MRAHWMVLAAAAAVAGCSPAAPKTHQSRVSYCIGLSFGTQLRTMPIELDREAVMRAIEDNLAGRKPALGEREFEAAATAYQKQMRAKRAAQLKPIADKNAREAKEFLAENARKEGVVALPSGLQYRVMTAGKGKSPAPADTVSVHFSGRLLSGREFVNSRRDGRPLTAPVGEMLVTGWREALPRMKVGGRWRLFVPPKLAFGEEGQPPLIGPNSALIFDVELMAINPPPEPRKP